MKFNSIIEAENWLREKEGDRVNLDTILNIGKMIYFEGGKYSAEITLNAFMGHLRKLSGTSQAELAKKVGVRTATISDFETGKKGINSKTLEKIFEVLQIEIKS